MHGAEVFRLSHEEVCALWFTRIESQMRQADATRMGIKAANQVLTIGWFMATRETEALAKHAYEVHVQAMAQAGR